MAENTSFDDIYGQKEIQLDTNDKNRKIGENFSLFPNSHPSEKLMILREMAIQQYGGISQFAKALQTDKSNASKILSGKYIPKKIDTIQKIADALHVNAVLLTQLFRDLEDVQTAEIEFAELMKDAGIEKQEAKNGQ